MLGDAGVTIEDARRFLVAHVGPSVAAVELVGEGAWSRCFGYRHRGDDLVIRFGQTLEFFEKDRRATAFAGPGLPVPTVHEIGPAFDGHFAISARVRGEPLENLPAAQWPAMVPNLLTVLDALRTADVSDTSGWGSWDATGQGTQPSWRDFLLHVGDDLPGERTYGWREKLAASPVQDDVFPEGFALVAALAEAAPPERYLVHADLVNRNVLVDDGRITGVFDWGCGLYGDFLYELAWLKFWSPWYPGLASRDIVEDVRRHLTERGVAVPDFDARLRGCLLHVGLNHHAWCVTVEDFDSLVRVNQQTRALIEGSVL